MKATDKTEERSPAILSTAGLGGIFALVDPSGTLRTCDTTLDGVTRTLVEKEMPTEMWNSIFSNPSPVERAKVYEAYGWKVMCGTFTPNKVMRIGK